MKPVSLIFLLLGMLNCAHAQVATINDKDGYTNVRSEPRGDAPIIYKLRDTELFLYDDAADLKTSEWIKVYVPQNKFMLSCSESPQLTGFIHSSRLMPLDNLGKYKGGDLVFRYKLAPFSTENKMIEYHDRWITQINGRRIFGTDGPPPKIEVVSIEAMVKGKKVAVPKVLFEDLFECDNEFTVYKHKDVYYVSQSNSDGAGGYLLVWAIDGEGVRQRLIMIP